MPVSSTPSSIWKGVRRTLLSSAGSASYTVKTESDNKVIFSGKAFSAPGANSVVAELFDILAPYLHQTFPPIAEVIDQGNSELQAAWFSRRFIVTYGGTNYNVDVFADYSYDDNLGAGQICEDRIYPWIWPDMPLVLSAKYCAAGSVKLLNGSGTTMDSLTLGTTGAVNILFAPDSFPNPGGKVRVQLPGSAYSPYYEIREACGGERWALYYVNVFGAWEGMPILGKVRRTDSFVRHVADRAFSRSDSSAAWSRNYLVEDGIGWEINTGTLSDIQSLKFSRNVPGATLAVLLDCVNGLAYPVTIASTEVASYKTISNSGPKPAAYTLKLKLLQDRVRI